MYQDIAFLGQGPGGAAGTDDKLGMTLDDVIRVQAGAGPRSAAVHFRTSDTVDAFIYFKHSSLAAFG